MLLFKLPCNSNFQAGLQPNVRKQRRAKKDGRVAFCGSRAHDCTLELASQVAVCPDLEESEFKDRRWSVTSSLRHSSRLPRSHVLLALKLVLRSAKLPVRFGSDCSLFSIVVGRDCSTIIPCKTLAISLLKPTFFEPGALPTDTVAIGFRSIDLARVKTQFNLSSRKQCGVSV